MDIQHFARITNQMLEELKTLGSKKVDDFKTSLDHAYSILYVPEFAIYKLNEIEGKSDKLMFKGCAEDIREWIETEIEEITDIFVMLQEDYDDEEVGFQIYLHSDNGNDLSEEQFAELETHGIALDPDSETSKSIMQVLGIRIVQIGGIKE